jgi:hypothetical protein
MDGGFQMNQLYAELQWLPRGPHDFSARVKSLGNSNEPVGTEIRVLASHALNLNQLTSLAKAMGKARGNGKSLDPLVPFRLAVLSNSTFDLIVPARVSTCSLPGIVLEAMRSEYD